MSDIVVSDCIACGTATDHVVLKPGDQNVTLQCTECQTVSTVNPKKMRVTQVKVVASEGNQSYHTVIDVPTDEPVAEGHEFELDGHRMLVTGLETMDGRFPKKAKAADLKQVFAKVFDQVILKISVNDKDVTRSYEQAMDPDEEVYIGQVLRVDEGLVAIKTMKSDQNRTLHKGFLLARNIRRVFCDKAPEHAVEGETVRTRTRGAAAKGEVGRPRRGPPAGLRRPGKGPGPRGPRR